jgi:hypothetical protein
MHPFSILRFSKFIIKENMVNFHYLISSFYVNIFQSISVYFLKKIWMYLTTSRMSCLLRASNASYPWISVLHRDPALPIIPRCTCAGSRVGMDWNIGTIPDSLIYWCSLVAPGWDGSPSLEEWLKVEWISKSLSWWVGTIYCSEQNNELETRDVFPPSAFLWQQNN